MLKITKMVDYGILVLSDMCQQPDHCVSVSQLSVRLGLGSSVVAKICRLLAKAGILDAARGAQGGYLLTLLPAEISLRKVIHAINGYTPLVSCKADTAPCACLSRCHLKPAWSRIEYKLTAVLNDVSMVDFLPQIQSSIINPIPTRPV